MKKTFLATITVLVLSMVASAATLKGKKDLTLFLDSDIAGTHLKAGDYRIGVEGSTATIYREGKSVATFAVSAEENATKYQANTVVYAGGERSVKEIRLGGTATKLVLQEGSASAAAAGGKN